MTMLAITILMLLAACFLAAAWPLLHLPRVRTILAGAAGSGCVAIASGTIGLLMSGFMPLAISSSFAIAGDDARFSDNVRTGDSNSTAVGPQTDLSHVVIPIVGEQQRTQIEEDGTHYACASTESVEIKAVAVERDSQAVESSEPVLHTPLEDTVKIPPGRPEWIDAEPDFTSAVHTIPVASAPFVHEGEARRALDQALVKATREYVAEQLGSELAARLIQYDAKTIKRKVVKADNLYHDVATYSVGPMHEYFALLEFGPEFRKELDRRWEGIRAKSRLSQVGLFGGAGLLLLASIFGYFRLDNATRGYYTGRLQFMAAAAILAIIGVGAVLSQWIHWL